MTIAALIVVNLLFFAAAYLAVSWLTGGMVPKVARVPHSGSRRRRERA